MANRFARNGGGNWNTDSTWSTTSGGSADTVAPTAADDVFLDVNSGNVTIASAAVCRSINCTGYTGILTHNSNVTLSIGDASGGSLTFVAGMTYTRGSTTTSKIAFVSTTTGNTITTGGKVFSDILINGVGGGWTLQDSLTANGSTLTTLDYDNGTLDTNDQTVTVGRFDGAGSGTRTLSLGSSTINVTGSNNPWSFNSSNLTFNAETSEIVMHDSGSNETCTMGGHTYNIFEVQGSHLLNQSATYDTLKIIGSNSTTPALISDQTVTNELILTGTSSTNRLFFRTDFLGITRTITITGATIIASNVDFQDITLSESTDLSAITGGSGDCGGNSNITFTDPATKYWVGNGGNWSDPTNHWATSSGGSPGTGNIPLPQDDVVFDANSFSSGSQTVTADIPRLGKSINWTGATNSPTFALTSTQNTIYGSLTLIPAMTFTPSSSFDPLFRGRGSFTLTSAGKSFIRIRLEMIGGTLTLQDSLICTTNFIHDSGIFDANDFNVTSGVISTIGSQTRTLTMGSGTWTCTLFVGSVWNAGSGTNLTLNAETSTIVISDTGSFNKTFEGGGKTYNNLTITGGGSGTIFIDGNNTFNTLTLNAPKTVQFGAGDTQTILGNFIALGTSGNIITIQSSSAGSAATLSKSSGNVTCDWLSLKDSTATGGANWYAGSNSTNVSGNSGWLFQDFAISLDAIDFDAIMQNATVSTNEGEVATSRLSYFYKDFMKQKSLGGRININQLDGKTYFEIPEVE